MPITQDELEKIGLKVTNDIGSITKQMTQVTNDVATLNNNATAAAGKLVTLRANNNALAAGLLSIDGELKKLTAPDPLGSVKRDAERLGAMPVVTKSLGGIAGNLKNIILLSQNNGNPKDIAAESLRMTGSVFEVAATICKMGGPYGKLAGEVLSALQGLCDMVAMILGLTNEKQEEPSLQDVLTNVIKSDRGFNKLDMIRGTYRELDSIAVRLQKMTQQHRETGRTFKSWEAVWIEAGVPGGSGYYSKFGEIQSWLEDPANLELDPDPWDDVLYVYAIAMRRYVENYVAALILAPRFSPDDSNKLHPEHETQVVGLEHELSQEGEFLKRITKIATRKAPSFHIGTDSCIYGSKYGFRAEREHWPAAKQGTGSLFTKLAMGPGGRLWALAGGSLLYTHMTDKNGQFVNRDAAKWPPLGSSELGDLAVAPRGGAASDVLGLRTASNTMSSELVCHYPWDEDDFDKMARHGDPFDPRSAVTKLFLNQNNIANNVTTAQQVMEAGRPRRYAQDAFKNPVGPDAAERASFRHIAAAPSGQIYLIDQNLALWHWNATAFTEITSAPPLSKYDGTYPGGTSPVGLAVHAGSDGLYIYGCQGIQYKTYATLHADGDNSEWTTISPPHAPGDQIRVGDKWEWPKMPTEWYYRSLTESEGGTLLVSIVIPGVSEGRVFRWSDGEWEVGAPTVIARGIVTARLGSHDVLNAFRNMVATTRRDVANRAYSGRSA